MLLWELTQQRANLIAGQSRGWRSGSYTDCVWRAVRNTRSVLQEGEGRLGGCITSSLIYCSEVRGLKVTRICKWRGIFGLLPNLISYQIIRYWGFVFISTVIFNSLLRFCRHTIFSTVKEYSTLLVICHSLSLWIIKSSSLTPTSAFIMRRI